MKFEQLFNSVIAEAINDPQELIPTHKLPSTRVIVSRIEELEKALQGLLDGCDKGQPWSGIAYGKAKEILAQS